jgi:hypothetical protein
MGVAVCVYVMVALARLLACLRVSKVRLVYMGCQPVDDRRTLQHVGRVFGFVSCCLL